MPLIGDVPSAIAEHAKHQGWTEIQKSGLLLWGYKKPKNVMPSVIPLDIEITQVCRQAGSAIGVSDACIAEAIATVIRSTCTSPSIKQPVIGTVMSTRGVD